MMKHTLTALALMLGLGACATTENLTQVAPGAVNYNKIVENANNELIVTNIVRAAERRPFYFTRISSINRFDSLSAEVGLAGSLPQRGSASNTIAEETDANGLTRTITQATGAAVRTLTPSAKASFQSRPTFNFEILDSQEFYLGILRPIEFDAFIQYVQQGWSAQQLALTTVESLTFRGNGTTVHFDNDPDDPQKIAAFRQLISCSKLTLLQAPGSKHVVDQISVSTSKEISEIATLIASDAWSLDALNNQKANLAYSISESYGIKADFSDCWKSKNAALVDHLRLENANLPEVLREQDLPQIDLGAPIEKWDHILPESATFMGTSDNAVGDDGFRVEAVLRSPHGILYFLGECLRNSTKTDGSPCYFERSADSPGQRIYVSNIKQSSEEGILNTSVYGEPYMVPKADGDDRTMQTIAYVNQLLNLNKKGASAFGSSPVVAITR